MEPLNNFKWSEKGQDGWRLNFSAMDVFLESSVASTWLVKPKLQKSWLLKSVQADSGQLGSIKYMINVVDSLV
jgi:hypothetical protein